MLQWLRRKLAPKEVYLFAKLDEKKNIKDLHDVSFMYLDTAVTYLASMKEEERTGVDILKIKVAPWKLKEQKAL